MHIRKNALVAADFLNDRVIPWYEEHEVKLLRILTDRGTEYCGNRETHEYQLYLAYRRYRPLQDEGEVIAEQKAIFPATTVSLAYMVLVIALPRGNLKNLSTLADLTGPGVRIAVGRPETTLLGKYAPQIFTKAGLSEAIGQNIVATAPDCQSMLTMLIMGQVDSVITWNVYEIPAADKIDIVWLSPGQITGVGAGNGGRVFIHYQLGVGP